MTSEEFKDARLRLGLDRGQMAYMLGFTGLCANDHIHRIEEGRRRVMPAQARLMYAYLAGYRPPDWGDNGLADIYGETPYLPAHPADVAI